MKCNKKLCYEICDSYLCIWKDNGCSKLVEKMNLGGFRYCS